MMRSDRRELLKSAWSMEELAEMLVNFQKAKDARYDGSWAKRGLYGYIYGCILRQTDRIEPVFDELVDPVVIDAEGVARKAAVMALLETLGDVALYAMMGIRLLATYDNDVFEEYAKKVLGETRRAG